MTQTLPLTNLRIIGIIIGLVITIWSFKAFRRNRLSTFLFLCGEFFGFNLIIVSIYPPIVNILVSMLSLQPQQHARLISLLIISNFILFFGFFHLYRKMDDQDYTISNLVVAMAKNDFYKNYPDFKPATVICIIPAYNEADNIGYVLKNIPQEVLGLRINTLVIDDCSEDNTSEIAKRHGAYVARLPIRMGGGAALRVGFMIVQEKNGQYIVTLDADGQHNPKEIENLLKPLLSDDVDVVVGSRILGSYENYSMLRTAGVKFFSRVISFLTASHITDCSSGFRAFKVDAIKKLHLRQNQYHTSELIIEAIKKGARIAEVPITISKRLSGTSKKGRDLLYGARFAKVILKTWLRGSSEK